jgi:uncharacterized membrane protein (UPF0127 family)
VRWLLIVAFVCACSKGAKREDAPMPPKPTPETDSTGSDQQARMSEAPSAKVYLSTPGGEVAVTVEVVSTEAKIERGLMYREHLPLDAGMLFMMGFEKDWSFWMRNTLIPLDMLFITKDMHVAGIVENAEPKTETLRKVGVPSFYVLEVNGGWTRKNNVVAGATVRFENVPQ